MKMVASKHFVAGGPPNDSFLVFPAKHHFKILIAISLDRLYYIHLESAVLIPEVAMEKIRTDHFLLTSQILFLLIRYPNSVLQLGNYWSSFVIPFQYAPYWPGKYIFHTWFKWNWKRLRGLTKKQHKALCFSSFHSITRHRIRAFLLSTRFSSEYSELYKRWTLGSSYYFH